MTSGNKRDTNTSADDEFGSSFMSEVEYNKRHKKALKKADPSYTEKKKPKKKKEHNWFKGLGSSSRGPGNR